MPDHRDGSGTWIALRPPAVLRRATRVPYLAETGSPLPVTETGFFCSLPELHPDTEDGLTYRPGSNRPHSSRASGPSNGLARIDRTSDLPPFGLQHCGPIGPSGRSQAGELPHCISAIGCTAVWKTEPQTSCIGEILGLRFHVQLQVRVVLDIGFRAIERRWILHRPRFVRYTLLRLNKLCTIGKSAQISDSSTLPLASKTPTTFRPVPNVVDRGVSAGRTSHGDVLCHQGICPLFLKGPRS
jgi:hypothetical protein